VSNNRYLLKIGAGLLVVLLTVLLTAPVIYGSIHWLWLLLLVPVWSSACALIVIIVGSIAISENEEISPDPNRVPPIPIDDGDAATIQVLFRRSTAGDNEVFVPVDDF
jgi:hypothetical protein